jgi:aminopeptidase N
MRLHHTLRFAFLSLLVLAAMVTAQAPSTPPTPSRADILRGEYSPWRANNDLLSYDLALRVDPDKKFLSGKNTIRFKMLKDDTRIQLDLFANLNVDKILHGKTELKYTRELWTVKVGRSTNWQTIRPTTEWQMMKTNLTKDEFEVATDLYYIEVRRD